MERTRPITSTDAPDADQEAFDLPLRSTPTAPISQAEAERVWQRAARLQAEAASRLEARSRELAQQQALQQLEADDAARPRPDSAFSPEDMRAIGNEAGISPEFVDLALQQLRAEEVRIAPVDTRTERVASSVLGVPEQQLTLSRVINQPRDAVLAAMQRILPADPYRLRLAEIIGDGPMQDAMLVFDIPQMTMGSSGFTSFEYVMTTAYLKQLVVTLHAVGEHATEVTMHLDVAYGKARNLKMGAWFSVFFAAVFGGIGFVVGDGGLTALLGATAGTTLGGGASMWVVRATYQWAIRKGREEIEKLLREVDINARTGGVFAPPPTPPTGKSASDATTINLMTLGS